MRRRRSALARSRALLRVTMPPQVNRARLTLEGPIRAVVLVENLGALCDLPAVDGWLAAHVAGWDTATVQSLLSRLGHVPIIHFSDLDPNGIRIYKHLWLEQEPIAVDPRTPAALESMLNTNGRPYG